MDIDVRPIRKAEDQCRWGTNWQFATYDRTATRALTGPSAPPRRAT